MKNMNKLESIFKTNKPLIGMIHFPPLIGYIDYPGFSYIVKKMLTEANVLERAGFDGIIIENNYDMPHVEKIPATAAEMFASLANILQKEIKIPFGLDVLWNDYEVSLAICATTSAKFFRIPAFVDTVKTNYGIMTARAKEAVLLRHKLNLDNVAILADIQVKHSEMIDQGKTIDQSAKEAVKAGADAIIVTGKWTGDLPTIKDLENTRNTVGNFPIIVGSGATIENLSILGKYTDGIIVGTDLKSGKILDKSKEINLKPFTNKVSEIKSILFAKKFNQIFVNR